MNIKRISYSYLVKLPLLLCLPLLLYMGVFAKRGWIDWRRMVIQNEELQSKIRTLQIQRENLVKRIESFRTHPVEQQYMVRQMLGYVRPDETVIEFE